MIIYGLIGDELNAEFFRSEREAVKKARSYGPQKETGCEVVAYEIGKLDKAKACELASGNGFALRQRDIWPKRGEWSR